MVVDCRFEYEYAGGHIRDAVNLNTPDQVEEYFFRDRQSVTRFMRTVVVFHCEYSQNRGPSTYRMIRNLDRELHKHFYPQLFFTEIYLLDGGYRKFYKEFPELCEGGYVEMEEKEDGMEK